MTATRFDPQPDRPYGRCNDCDAELATEPDARTHMDETMSRPKDDQPGGRSHRITVLNPDRQHRISSHVSYAVSDAAYDVCLNLIRLVENEEATVTEISDAINSYPDFADAWADFLSDGEAGR